MNRLREIRKSKDVTQFELGKNINVHPQKISEFEHGRRDLRLSEAIKAARFLGVTVNDLVGDESGDENERDIYKKLEL